VGGASGNASTGGNAYGGAIYNTTAPVSETGITFGANSVVAGAGGVDDCLAGYACPGSGGAGGGGGAAGTGGTGGLDGAGSNRAPSGTNGVVGSAGVAGAWGVNGVGGNAGKALYQDQYDP
jgi:hypothetical protein